jgi:hypothetical protein
VLDNRGQSFSRHTGLSLALLYHCVVLGGSSVERRDGQRGALGIELGRLKDAQAAAYERKRSLSVENRGKAEVGVPAHTPSSQSGRATAAVAGLELLWLGPEGRQLAGNAFVGSGTHGYTCTHRLRDLCRADELGVLSGDNSRATDSPGTGPIGPTCVDPPRKASTPPRRRPTLLRLGRTRFRGHPSVACRIVPHAKSWKNHRHPSER